QNYNEHAQTLDAYLANTIESFPDKDIQEALHATDDANRRLIVIERKSFALVKEGKRGAADDTLDSPEYAKQKIRYAQGMRDFTKKVREKSSQPLLSLANNLYDTLYMILPVIALLSVTWYFAIRSLRRWRRELEGARLKVLLAHADEQQAKSRAE